MLGNLPVVRACCTPAACSFQSACFHRTEIMLIYYKFAFVVAVFGIAVGLKWDFEQTWFMNMSPLLLRLAIPVSWDAIAGMELVDQVKTLVIHIY